MTIQWFPGHMAKAKREVKEKLKLVDFVMELVDARAPESSQNPMLQHILGNKPKLLVLMKKDLADAEETEKWLEYFKKQDVQTIAIDVNQQQDIKALIQMVNAMSQQNQKKLQEKGIQARPKRAMIIGIPNVGKSTLINRLANKKIAKIGDRPGVTKHQSWIKVKKEFELLDTPGILWPKFEDKDTGYRLAAIGTIKDQLLTLQDVSAYVLKYLQRYYPNNLKTRYGLDENIDDMWEVFEKIGRKTGALESGGHINFDRVAEIILRDLREGRIGRVTLEVVSE